MKPTCIFLVFGQEVDKDLSNLKTINTKVVPNVGEEIIFRGGLYKVKRKVINYSQVENHAIDSDERGKEMIYIFI